MIKEVIFLQVLGNYRGAIGNTLSRWEQMGFFDYVLPFLLIFALVFGLLTQIKIFKENKSINAIIALVVSLMALQFELVPLFFSELFPRVGIALSVLLTLIILVGLFFNTDDNQILNYGMLAVAVIIFLIILTKTTGYLGWYSGNWWYENRMLIITIGIILAIVIAVINSVGEKAEMPPLTMNWPKKK